MPATFHPADLASGTVTSWLPLTTTFASNPACSNAIYSQVSGQLVAFDPLYAAVIDVPFSTQCLPFEGTMWWNQIPRAVGTTSIVSSLGPIVCPEAYTTAFTLALESATTKVACCPS